MSILSEVCKRVSWKLAERKPYMSERRDMVERALAVAERDDLIPPHVEAYLHGVSEFYPKLRHYVAARIQLHNLQHNLTLGRTFSKEDAEIIAYAVRQYR